MYADAALQNFIMEAVEPGSAKQIMECIHQIPLIYGECSIQDKFDSFMSKFITTEVQNEVAYRLMSCLSAIANSSDGISFERSVEQEIVFVYKNVLGINLISIDLDGDLMISVSPFVGEDGLRMFQDYNEIDELSAVGTFLS